MALLIVGLVLLQVAAGGFVAGLDAGFGYNTWPLMEGALVPQGLFVAEAVVAQHVRECADRAVQSPASRLCDRRARGRSMPMWCRAAASLVLLAAVGLQVALGIWTLLWAVPLWLGLAHQGGALLVLAAAIWNLHMVLSGKAAAPRSAQRGPDPPLK